MTSSEIRGSSALSQRRNFAELLRSIRKLRTVEPDMHRSAHLATWPRRNLLGHLLLRLAQMSKVRQRNPT